MDVVYVLVLEIYSQVDDFHDRIVVGCYDAIDVALNDAKTISSAYRINRNHPFDCDVKYVSIYSRKLGKPDLDRKPICGYSQMKMPWNGMRRSVHNGCLCAGYHFY